ncbi:TPA: hypothetical protein ACH3X3_003492 [Trebouxia sp. C0006]
MGDKDIPELHLVTIAVHQARLHQQAGFDATRESVSLPLLPAPWQQEPMDVLKLRLSAMV